MPRTRLTPAEGQERHDLAARGGQMIARRTGDDALGSISPSWNNWPQPPPDWSKAPCHACCSARPMPWTGSKPARPGADAVRAASAGGVPE